MAVKEILIVFVYDLEFCKTEDDDPLKAIKYFHPSWISDHQKLALCGQLMGLMNFCSDFEIVDFISLQNGKFKVERFGRFILAMGTDRNVQESLLKHRTDLMSSILRLYHNDINKIYEQFNEQKNFCDKLYHIFETYLPVLQYNSNLLQNVYKLQLPKSANNIFLEAIQILENVASKQGVLGGMILYNNKVVGTQFSIDLTKILIATDPVRIKTTAEISKNVNFHIPTGSQIIKIFITLFEYNRLQNHIKKVTDSTSLSLGIQNTFPLPFSFKKKTKESSSSMKRDKSLIFTHIPEEEALVEILSPIEKARNRPNHLPLKLKTIPPESGIASIVSFDETDSFPDFIGKTSVVATPMTENKILAGPIQSIFAITTETSQSKQMNGSMKVGQNQIENGMKSDEKEAEVDKKWENIYISYANNPFKNLHWKKNSCDDLLNSNNMESDFDKSYNVYNTISDSMYPIFDDKKRPLSKTLFDDYQQMVGVKNDSQLKLAPPKEVEEKKIKPNLIKKLVDDPMIMKRSDATNSPSRLLRNQKKKMLKLPIKSFSLDNEVKPSTSNATVANNATTFDSPSTKTKKYMGGLQLTPLMSKLTLLAMSENENFSSGLSSFDLPTPNYYDTPIDNTNRSLFNRLSKVDEEKHEPSNDAAAGGDVLSNEMKRVDLLVCEQKNMTLMVIINENSCDHQMMQQMFEICINRLSRLEQKLNDVINVTVDLKASEYSFMTFDRNWNVKQRSGANDLQSTLLMHDNFNNNKDISDIIIKTNDSIIYGHNSGDSEVFYQHASKQQSSFGFLAPSEFTIISQAKRKLERDQSIVLF